MVNNFDDVEERNLDDFAVGTFDFDAGRGERLRRFHTADDAAHAAAVLRNDFNIILAVKRLEGCEGFSYFHCISTALSFPAG